MDFSIEHEFDEANNRWNVKICGEIDIFNSELLKSSLLELVNERKADLNLNFEELVYIDSTALGSLVAVLKNVKQYEGDVYIYNLKPNLAKIFKITNLDKVFITEVN